MKPRPKSIVLDVLSTLKGRSAPVRFLVATTAVFDIDANATRVAITRLLASGLVERDERGAYRTGAAATPIVQRLDSWRSIDTRTRPWSGAWIGSAPDAGTASREDRAAATRAFGFSGMKEFSPGLWIRPDNLDGGLETTRETLRALGLPPASPVFIVQGLDPASDARARTLWDAEVIRREYRQLRVQLERSAEALPRLDEKKAMAESFLLGGEAIRRIVLDPLLPDAIVATGERSALVEAMRAYDEVGRRCWSRFLDRYGVLLNQPPMDRRLWRDAAGDFATAARETA